MFISFDKTSRSLLLLGTIFFTLSIQNNLVVSTELNHQNITDGLNKSKVKPKIMTMRGKLIYEEIPPVRSSRAYLGEEFFLIPNTKNTQRLVLRPSAKVTDSKLKTFHNQQVEITAVYVKGTRPSPLTACPVDISGQCLPQGEGYQVLTIKAKP